VLGVAYRISPHGASEATITRSYGALPPDHLNVAGAHCEIVSTQRTVPTKKIEAIFTDVMFLGVSMVKVPARAGSAKRANEMSVAIIFAVMAVKRGGSWGTGSLIK
jgi:hypothetical protein